MGEGGQTQHFPKLHWTYSYIKYFNGFLTEIFGISHWGHDIVFSVLLKNIFCPTGKAKETTGDKYLPNSQWACNFFTMTILDLEPQDICNCNVIFFSAQHHFHFLEREAFFIFETWTRKAHLDSRLYHDLDGQTLVVTASLTWHQRVHVLFFILCNSRSRAK